MQENYSRNQLLVHTTRRCRTMIKLEKVNKYFNHRRKNEIHIIHDTSLELGDTGLVAILGQSGSGKTTLLNAIGGLDKVNKGKIYINGEKITKRRAKVVDRIRNLNIGYIFQDYKLIDHMTVYDNIALALRMNGLKNKKEIQERVNYVLEAVGMYRYRNRFATMLSGGEKQRVAIARAIVKNPSIVIADEPTGNLDSKNSLEIMNIIKAISKEKLVILVTHEVELANFYATRIIEVQDGQVKKDYRNENADTLEYRLDNKVYLKDLQNLPSSSNDKLNIKAYADEVSSKIEVTLVLKNGNLYVEAKDRKVEIVDENSAIELIDDHYQKIDKSIYEKYKYNLEEVSNKKYKPKYSSIYGIAKSIRIGFKRILNYSILKKILLLGFFASAMFIVYSICNITGVQEIHETDYLQIDPNYVQVDTASVALEDYLAYEQLENIDYLIPGNGNVSFKMTMDTYYQLAVNSFALSGTLVDLDKINASDIILGRMPENEYELVIDKKVIDNLLDQRFSLISHMGIKSFEDLLGKKVQIDSMSDFQIVGFVDHKTDSIYTPRGMFINILNNMEESNYGMYFDTASTNVKIRDYELLLDDITITKGRLPQNDYEVIVPKANQETMKLNKTTPEIKVNGKELTVVGYYDSKTNRQDFLVNPNTVKYQVITTKNGFMIYTYDKTNVVNQFRYEYKQDAKDRYEKDKNDYLNGRKEEVKGAVIFAAVILAISLVEIYLMMRSSFLSRIKEIGVYRAIGVKKADIYRMFIGEILAITTVASMPGVMLMTYILSQVSQISYIDRLFILNPATIGFSILIIYAFNLLVGLAPLYRVLRKTPASILARHDVE